MTRMLSEIQREFYKERYFGELLESVKREPGNQEAPMIDSSLAGILEAPSTEMVWAAIEEESAHENELAQIETQSFDELWPEFPFDRDQPKAEQTDDADGTTPSETTPIAAMERSAGTTAPESKTSAAVKGGEQKLAKQKSKKKLNAFTLASNAMFYFALAAILMTAVLYTAGGNGNHTVFGYSYFTVLSGSMQREIPQGSLVLTRETDTAKLAVDDDITFIRSDNNTVTHRIVNIIEDYNGSGTRGFVTKGLENPDSDKEVVQGANVIGKVILSVPELGFALAYVADHLIGVLALFGVIIAISMCLGVLFGDKKNAVSALRKQENKAVAGV